MLLVIFTCLSSACSDRSPKTEEAYKVGYDMGLADQCGKHGVRTEPMPSAYDDSLDEGILASAFQEGYWDAREQDNPCR